MGRVVEVAFGRNLALDAEVIALGGTKAAYASDAEPEPRLPFWPLLFKNVTIRLVGSDDLPEGCLAVEKPRPLRSVPTRLAGNLLRRFPRSRSAWRARR